jgi:hypothetical protein
MANTGRVFLCHNSNDKALVKQLALALLQLGAVRTWLDEWETTGGDRWESHIRKEFSASASCLVLVGASGLGPFQTQEIAWANDRSALDASFKVIPVLLPGASADQQALIHQAIPGTHWVALGPDWNTLAGLGGLLAAIRGHRQGPPVRAISLAVAAENWDGGGRRDSSLLYRGRALAEARSLATQRGALDELSQEFLAASNDAARRRGALLTATLVASSLVLAGTAWWANLQREEAVHARGQETQAREREALQRAEAERQRDAAKSAEQAEAEARREEELQRKEAETQRDIARKQTQLAEQRRAVAESRAMAADARRILPQELAASLRQSALAYARSPTVDAWIALMASLERARHIKWIKRCASGDMATGTALSHETPGLAALACQSGQRTTVHVLNESGRTQSTHQLDGDQRALAFVGNSHLVAGGTAGLVRVDLTTGAAITLQKEPVTALAEAPALGGVLVGGSKGSVTLSRPAEPAGSSWVQSTVAKVSFMPSSLMLRADGQVEVRGLGDQWAMLRLDGGEGRGSALPWVSESGRLPPGACTGPKPVPSVRYFANATTPAGHAYAFATETNELVVMLRKGSGCHAPYVLTGHTHNILAVALSADGQQALSAGALFDADEGHGLIAWNLQQRNPSFSAPDDSTASGLAKAGLQRSGCNGPKATKEGWRIQESERRLVALHEASRMKRTVSVPREAGDCGAIAISTDGSKLIRLSSGYEPALLVTWPRGGGAPITDLWPNPLRAASGLRTVLRHPVLSHNGDRLVATSDGSAVAVFDLVERRLIGTLAHDRPSALQLTEDSSAVLAQEGGKTVKWVIEPKQLAAKALALSGAD